MGGSVSHDEERGEKLIFTEKEEREFESELIKKFNSTRPSDHAEKGKTIFEYYLKKVNSAKEINWLKSKNADLYSVNRNSRYYPLLYAIDSMCPGNVAALLKGYDSKYINVRYENQNSLHLLVKLFVEKNRSRFSDIAECIKILIDTKCSPNMPDDDFKTPFQLILEAGENSPLDKELQKILVEYFINNSSINTQTYRSDEILALMNSQNIIFLDMDEKNEIDGDFLRYLLKNDRFEEFKTNFEIYRKKNELCETGSPTLEMKPFDNDFLFNCSVLLNIATRDCMTDIVEFLISQNVDINRYPIFEQPAAFIACSYGYDGILDLFLKHKSPSSNEADIEVNYENRNLMHEVCRNFINLNIDENRNYHKCFELLDSCNIIDINQQDDLGFTPLGYAIRYKNDEATKALLRRSYIGQRDKFNKTQIYSIGREVFEEFLDECITKSFWKDEVEVGEKKGEQKITIDFGFLVAPETSEQKFFDDISPLEDIANNVELRELILHPVLSIFLYLRWIKLGILFYTNLLFFFVFMGSFITYVVFLKNSEILFTLSLFLLFLMIVKEVLQIFLLTTSYFKSKLNWFELFLIILIWIVLFEVQLNSDETSTWMKNIRGFTILCTALELMILFGDLPIFSVSTHMAILECVFKTFLKSTALFTILLMGFAFCFLTVFGDDVAGLAANETKSDGGDFHFFNYPGFAIIKTIVMFSGELDSSNLLKQDDAFQGFIFLLFVFLITIVLLNLLNGLSVSDVIKIKKKAHLVSMLQKIHVLNRYERSIMSKDFLIRWCKGIISISPNMVKNGIIEIDRNYKVKLYFKSSSMRSCFEKSYNLVLKILIRIRTFFLENQDNEKYIIQIDRAIVNTIKNYYEKRDKKLENIEQLKQITDIQSMLQYLVKERYNKNSE